MKKRYLTLIFLALSILTAQTAFAQSYLPAAAAQSGLPAQSGAYYSTPSAPSSYGICTDLSRDLSVGSRGVDVLTLQNFLLSQNYPGAGSWMVTGYFGAATKQAVLNFQSQKGIPMSGVADAAIRAAIRNLTCLSAQGGGAAYGAAYPSQTPSYPPASYTPPTESGNVTISSLSVYSGPVGTQVTIYGSGFDPVYNNVYFGNYPLPGNFASNGTVITFTVPASYRPNCTPYNCYPSSIYTSIGTFPVYVTNARGVSNSLSFTVTGNAFFNCLPSPFGNCGYGSSGFGNYGYGTPYISNMYPTSGAPGTIVTILGSGFTQRNNSVRFGNGIITGLMSSDGTSLSFAVPSQLTGYGQQTLTAGTYNVSVTNEFGVPSNALPFTVTSVWQSYLTPTISFFNGPTSLNAGMQGTWIVQVNNPSNTNITVSVRWGDEATYGTSSFSSQLVTAQGTQTISFTHTYSAAGNYTIVFTASNNAGGQNSVTATVNVGNVSAQTANVQIANVAFIPSQITVRAGTTVRWSNADSIQHSVTSNTGLFNSGTLLQGGTFQYTFNTPGTYTYYCIFHPFMTGAVTVTP